MDFATCADCGAQIVQMEHKALDGNWATLWTAAVDFGEWICPKTGDEHRPA